MPQITDDIPKFAIRRDVSGGMNTRQADNVIAENQSTLLQNVEITVMGERSIRKGATLLASLGSNPGTGLLGYSPIGGTDVLLATHGSTTVDLATNLVAYYKCNDNAASSAVDDEQNAYEAKLYNDAAEINTNTRDATGKIDGGLELDGDKIHISCGDVTELNSANKFSLCGWFKQDVLDTEDYFFYKWKDADNILQIHSYTDGNFYASIYTAGALFTGYFDYSTVVTAGTFFHLAVTFDLTESSDAERVKIYIDGAAQTLSFTGTAPATTPNLGGAGLRVGNNASSFDGVVDDIRVYDATLTASEVASLHNGGQGTVETTLAGILTVITSAGVATDLKVDLTPNLDTKIVNALESDEGDVAILSNGTDNCFRINDSYTLADLGDTNTSPPLTTVMEYYRDRLWTLKDEQLSYSGAVPADYSSTFVRDTNYYSIPVGDERFLLGTRNYGLIIGGSRNIYLLNPSVTPDPATDKPDKMVDYGCASGDTAIQVADDFLYLSYDGVRGLFRTINDELQTGESKPLSWNLKKETELINWTYATKACAVYFDNKYILSLPTGSSTVNNTLWIYYPSYKSWVVINGLYIAKMAKLKVSNEERLYGIDANNGNIYRMFYGVTDNGTAIEYIEEGRGEDFGEPLRYKQGGEVKVKVINKGGVSATLTPYADIDDAGYVQLDGTALTVAGGGLDFNFDFPFSFDSVRGEEQWHLDNLGKFKKIKIKLYCNTTSAELTILESQIITFVEEYLNED